jgi:hypothetical protein
MSEISGLPIAAMPQMESEVPFRVTHLALIGLRPPPGGDYRERLPPDTTMVVSLIPFCFTSANNVAAFAGCLECQRRTGAVISNQAHHTAFAVARPRRRGDRMM